MLTDERMTVTLHEMDRRWSLGDLADAHAALDVRDALLVKSRQPQ